MKITSNGISEVVLEVKNMDQSVDFWHKKLGFPIVDQWGYSGGQFSKSAEKIWATWFYIGGSTRLGLWLPRDFNKDQKLEKSKPISHWNGLFDEGGIHVHIAFFVDHNNIDSAIKRLEECNIDYKLIVNDLGHKRVYFKDPEENVIEFYTLNMYEDYLMRLNEGLL